MRFLTNLALSSFILIAIAGVITPIGLYDAFGFGNTVTMPFYYVRDETPVGYGTPSRSELEFNRICGALVPVACPNSNTVVISSSFDNGTIAADVPYGFNTSIPGELYELYSSGAGGRGTTVSNFFDIQWRQYYV